MHKIYISLILILFCGGGLLAQDIHFSQFYQAPLHLNPAMTGVMECTQRFTANYRNQWSSIIANEFQTYSASYDRKFASGRRDYFGAGMTLWGDRVGSANLGTYQARLSGSYSRYMGGTRRTSHYLAVGADAAITSRSINIAELQWGTQHDGRGRFDGDLPSLEEFAEDQFLYADMSVGLLWFSNLDNGVSFYAGGAASHINRPRQSFFDDNEIKLYTKYTLHGGAEFGFGNNLALLPGFVTFFQGPSFQLNAGTSGRIYLDGTGYSNSESFQLGIWARMVNNFVWNGDGSVEQNEDSSLGLDAVILSARFDYDKFGIGFSYDINVSDLNTASNGRGAFEFSLIYNICGDLNRGVYCPRF